MTNPRLPQLMDHLFHPVRLLEPISLSIEMNLSTISTAVMTLPLTQAVEVNQFVELFTVQGSAGIFRVMQVERGNCLRVSLSHGLITLADTLFQAEQDAVTLPAAQLFSQILSQQQHWQAGTIDLPADLSVTCQAGDVTLLEALFALMNALPAYHLAFDQSTTPWTLHLLPHTTLGLSECRLTRNLKSLTIETDRSELCTRLYLPGIPEPMEADTLPQWGAITRRLEADSGLTEEELRQRGQQYLDQHKAPLVTITLDALELSRLTGCSLDHFSLGSPCRVCLPEEKLSFLQRVVNLSWPDVFGSPNLVRVALANRAKSASSLLAGLIVDSTQVRRQVTRHWDALSRQKDLLLEADESISLLSRNIDIHAADILALRSGVGDNQASITLANDRIAANAAAITLKADQTVVNAQGQRLSSAEAAIDGVNATIKLKANQSVVNDQGQRLSSAEAAINGANAAIKLKADQTVVNAQGQRLSSAEAAINGANAAIKLKADQSVVNAQGQRLSSAEAAIDGANAAINLKASKADLDSLGKRVTSAEASIQVNANSITSKVSKNGIISAINQTAETVRISASKINLDGYVTATQMETKFADIMDGYADELTTGTLTAGDIVLGTGLTATNGYVSANTISASASMTLDGKAVATQSWADSRYYTRTYCNANYATFTHLSSNYATKAKLNDYQLKSGLTTKTIKPVTSITVEKGSTPDFYQGNTKIAGSMKFVTAVSANTTEYTVVVYA